MYVLFPAALSMIILLRNPRDKMGNSFLSYSAKDNNCQNFILFLLESNGLSNSRNVLFVKQSTGNVSLLICKN